ncbi:glycoside hydrolase family 105 protein [Moniliophthora roreri]|nr:glycoside hydrolase family 105 protein [Moniliophthora roreri]
MTPALHAPALLSESQTLKIGAPHGLQARARVTRSKAGPRAMATRVIPAGIKERSTPTCYEDLDLEKPAVCAIGDVYFPFLFPSSTMLWFISCFWVAIVAGQQLPDAVLENVKARLGEKYLLSWEIGTRIQALLELDSPSYSVFTTYPQPVSIPFPRYQSPTSGSLSEVMSIVRTVVANRTMSNFGVNVTSMSYDAGEITGPQPLMYDLAAADPTSIGPGVLLAGHLNLDGNGSVYMQAAKDQLDFLYTRVPRTYDGAISHRLSELQLWSDSVSMIPPFLALYGAQTYNATLIRDAYAQIRLYRSYFTNAYSFIGNGWAAHGILRVLATIQHSYYADEFIKEREDMLHWAKEIIGAMYHQIDDTSIFRNYANNASTFYDTGSTALLAASAYRLSLLSNGTESHWIPYAERSRKALSSTVGNGNYNLKYFTSDGWVEPVANPHWYVSQGTQNPEAQAFVLMMQSAWKEWVAAGSANFSSRVAVEWRWLVATVLMGCWIVL